MTTPLQGGARPINFAPFGIYTRHMLGAYLRNTLMVAVALMTIALAIDLLPQIALLKTDPAQSGLVTSWALLRLAMLRVPDLLPPFIPFAVFLGVVWSEGAFTQSRERMLVWNSGHSPIQCLAPALMIGLVMGVGLFVLDGYLRPAAIAVQMRERLGREGERLDRSQSGGHHWIALPDGLLRAEIEYGPPLRLHNATIYKLDDGGHLSEVDTAVLATPLGGDRWHLEDGHYWRADPQSSVAGEGRATFTFGSAREESETPFTERVIPMALNVLWLGNQGLSPQYLPMPVLRTLAHARIDAHDKGSFQTRLDALYGSALLPGGMALLAASLSMLLFAYRLPPVSLVVALLAGYLAHFSARAFLLMGEFGYVPPFVAGWFVPLMILAAGGLVLLLIQRRRGLGASLNDTPSFGGQADDTISE